MLHMPRGYSLVPRPFPPPVFDRILYAKTEGDQKLEAGTAWERGYRGYIYSLVPRPLPDFICEIKSGSGLGTRLPRGLSSDTSCEKSGLIPSLHLSKHVTVMRYR